MQMQYTNSFSQLKGYQIGKTIGRGTFGKVKKAINKLSNQPVAIKFLQKDKIKDIGDIQRVSRELHILKIVRHPAIAQLYEIIQNSKMIYIIMQFATKGEYFDYVMDGKVKNQQEAFHYFSQIVSALIYLHKLKIAHRDVKPQNILLDTKNKIKIVDFGLSNMYKKDEKLITACGSPCYASPQMIKGQIYDPQLTDVWSLGIVLYTSVMANLPFQDDNTNALYSKIKSGSYVIDKKISPQLKDLLSKLINVKPENRLRLQQIKKHPWYQKYNNHKEILGIQIGYQQIPIDYKIIAQLSNLGFDSRKTIKILENNIKNHCTATYYLLLKKYFKQGKGSNLDICSQNFDKLNIMPLFKTKMKRYKSFDLGKNIQLQSKNYSVVKKKSVNLGQLRNKYSSSNNFEENLSQLKKQKVKNLEFKTKLSFYNAVKTNDSEIKWKLVKNAYNRNRSITLSNQNKNSNSKKSNKFLAYNQESKTKFKLNPYREQNSPGRIIKTEFINETVNSQKKSKQKKQKSFRKNEQKSKKLGYIPSQNHLNDIFWKKKSNKAKQISSGIKNNLINESRKNIRINNQMQK